MIRNEKFSFEFRLLDAFFSVEGNGDISTILFQRVVGDAARKQVSLFMNSVSFIPMSNLHVYIW